MREKKIIAGNWKMAPKTTKEAIATFKNIKQAANKLKNVQTIICPPHLYVNELVKSVSGHRCVVGAQNTHWEKEGAHTGEVSVTQLKNSRAEYVIVGHSERRASGESDVDISLKINALLKAGLTPILCIGEKERDEEGKYANYVKNQLLASLDGVGKRSIQKIVIAYEPVWAIGKKAKREATPEDVLEMVIFLRKVINDTYGKKASNEVPILYGGSANPKNTQAILERGQADGLLVGRASLKPGAFTQMLEIANKI